MMAEKYELEHLHSMRKLAPECMVLLKSNGDFPLRQPCDIALYGGGARHTVKGGSGSGDVNSRFFTTIEEGLQNEGFSIPTREWLDSYDRRFRKEQKKFVKQIKRRAKENKTNLFVELIGSVMPEPEYEIPINGKGDTAIYVLSRYCGEGGDRSAVKGDVYLSDTEVRDILTCQRRYKKFLLVLNVGGVVDLSPVISVDNILLLSQLGVATSGAFADVLLGKAYPSGKLTATWSKMEDYQSIGDFGNPDDTLYKEGIYVGYRYFDTVSVTPLFPFGYGLGYTDFEVTADGIFVEKNIVTIRADVKNTGRFPGREVVQVYVSQPQGKLDKPYQVLAGYIKTKELLPGESQKAAIHFKLEDIASYDEERASYILESGDYIIRIGNSSRNTDVCGVLELKEEVIIRKLSNIMEKPSFADWKPVCVRSDAEKLPDVQRIRLTEDNYGNLIFPKPASVDGDALSCVKKLSDEELCYLCMGAHQKEDKTASVIGDAALKVAGAAGETYSRVKGVPGIIMADGPAGLRLDLTYAEDENGVQRVTQELPDGLELFLPLPFRVLMRYKAKADRKKGVKYQACTAILTGTAIAQSWNLDLAERCGDIVGNEMERFHIHLWLAPAFNIQRNPLCGRNFEYYSEDPLISGQMGAAVTKGVQKHQGRGTCVKHFCCNNQEENRTHSNSQVNERALREIYLKPFEICISESDPVSVMTSNNLVNGIHTAESLDLLKEVLRKEWGYQGFVMTDWTIADLANKDAVYPMTQPALSVKAGNDLFMPGSHKDYLDLLNALSGREASCCLTREEVEFCAANVVHGAWRLAGKSELGQDKKL